MNIYESRIEASSQYEGELCPMLVEYGTDKAELKRRQVPVALKIAPDAAWTFNEADGTATVSVKESEHYTVDYVAYVRRIELVC